MATMARPEELPNRFPAGWRYHYPGTQVFTDQAQYPFVANLSRHPVHQDVMIDRVEELRQVYIDGNAIAFTYILAGLIDRMMEKLIPDVIEAANGWGQRTLDRSMGEKPWLVPVTSGLVVTEIEALGIMAGVEVRHIASGGIGGSEGAVVLLLEGYEKNLDKAWEILESVKGAAPIGVPRHAYACEAESA